MRARVQWLASACGLAREQTRKRWDKDAVLEFRSAWDRPTVEPGGEDEAYSQAISSSRATPCQRAIRPRIDRRGWRGAGLPGLSYS